MSIVLDCTSSEGPRLVFEVSFAECTAERKCRVVQEGGGEGTDDSGFRYFRKFLPNVSRIHPVMALLKKGAPFKFIAEVNLPFALCLLISRRLRFW